MQIDELNLIDAKEICAWKYDKPYDIYNYPSWDIVCSQNWAITDNSKRKEQFKKVISNNHIIGYFRYQIINNEIILGLGLNPSYCGQGYGTQFMNLIIEYLLKKQLPIKLEAREFNVRAIKCYEKVGFKIIDKKYKETLIGNSNFYIMELNCI